MGICEELGEWVVIVYENDIENTTVGKKYNYLIKYKYLYYILNI